MILLTRFALRRLLAALLVLLVLSIAVYALFYVLPGDPARLACGPKCTADQVAQVRTQLGLDDPAFAQYAHFLHGLFAGTDISTGVGTEHCGAPCLGFSYQSGEQVTSLLAQRCRPPPRSRWARWCCGWSSASAPGCSRRCATAGSPNGC